MTRQDSIQHDTVARCTCAAPMFSSSRRILAHPRALKAHQDPWLQQGESNKTRLASPSDHPDQNKTRSPR